MKTALKFFSIIVICAFIFGFASPKPVSAATITVCGTGCDFTSIQAAIDAAVAGDVITVANGTYTETLNIYKNLTITGESEAGVVIDTHSFSDYGIDVAGDIITVFNNFTLIGPAPAAFGYGLKISGENAQTTIQNVTVKNSARSGIDLNGLIGGTIDHVTLQSNGGVGLALTDSSNITVSNITTSGNAWGGMAIFTAGASYTGGSDNITLSGTNSFSETNKLYIQTIGYPVTNLHQTDFGFSVMNNTDLPGTIGFYKTQLEATTVALMAAHPEASVITNRTDNSKLVVPGMSIQAAINAASTGDTINVTAGTYVLASAITVNKDVTLNGVDNPLLQVSGTGERIFMTTPGATLQGFWIEKTDKAGIQNIIYVGANNLTIQNNKIWGRFVIATDGSDPASRAMVFTGGLSGLLITNNEIYDLRQPGYISGVTTGTISNNFVYRTKGWVIEQGDMTFTNNTWGTGADANVYDIAILSDVSSSYYTDIPGMAAANNNAFIEDQRTSPATLSIVYVDGSVTTSGDGTARSPKKTIGEGVTRVITGGTIHVAAGTYDEENIVITKGLKLLGAGAGTTFIAPSTVTNNSTIVVQNPTANVLIDGFTFTMQPKVNYGSAIVITGTTIPVDSATVTITHNIVNGSNDGTGAEDYGFYGQGNNARLIISSNVINHTGANPICMENQFGSSTVSNNTIYMPDNIDSDAYFSMAYGGTSVTTPQIVEGNTFYLDHAGSGYSEAITFDTAVLNSWSGTTTDTGHYSDIQIRNNTIYTGGADARGIGLFDLSSADGFGTISGAEITGNHIIGENAADVQTFGITLRGDVEGSLIQDNLIGNVNLGIWLRAGLNGIFPTGSDISDNRITPTVTALKNDGTTLVDASPNWWGTPSAALIQAKLTGPVTFKPFWLNEEMTLLSGTLVTPVYVDDAYAAMTDCGTHICGYDAFSTIEDAVAVVSAGGTIHVAAGTYNPPAPIALNKSLSIIGPTSGEAIVSGAGGGLVKVFEITASNVTIQGLTITLSTPPTNYDGLINIPDNAVSNINILNNKIYVSPQSGAMSTWWARAIQIGRHVTGSTVSGNEMYNTRSGLVTGYNSAITIANNVIYNTKGGIMNYTGTQADADARVMTNNSWGSVHNEWDIVWNSGGGPYDMDMHKSVLLVSQANNEAYVVSQLPPAYPAPLLYGNRSHVFVNAATGTTTIKSDNGNINVPYARIQDGIDGVVPGGKVIVAAGTYPESILIAKDIHLVGAGAATTTISAPATLPVSDSPDSAIIRVDGSGVEAEITGFTISGPGPSACGSIRSGIYVRNSAYADIHDNIIADIRDAAIPLSGCQNGVAILVGRQAWATTGTATIANNQIIRYQKGAIVVDNTGSNAIITGNTITGIGTTTITAQNGIQISRGATATLTGNTITGNSYHVDGSTWDWGAAGILLYQPGAVTLAGGNNVSGNDQNLYIDSPTSAIVVGAEVFGPVTGPLTSSYQVINDSAFDIDLTHLTINGVDLSTATPEQILPLAPLIWDGIDDPSLGVAKMKSGYQFVDSEGTIQAAIDAATPGDIILVAPGTYVENVIVNKTVEIYGSGQGSTIVMPALSAYNPAGCSGSLCAGSSHVFLVQANNVKIHDLTVDGDNPALTTGLDVGGANVDARNGIITNHSAGVFNNLEIYNVTVQNIYLRGIYASSEGSFNIHHNTVTNVQGENGSIALFAWGGPGIFDHNSVSHANDAISANHSKGIQFTNNIVTLSSSGIHTDNSNDGGGVADLIQGNSVDCTGATNAYGIWVFVPYVAPTVNNNVVLNCAVGLSAWGQGAAVIPQFTNNTVTGDMSDESVGAYITTDLISWGYTDVSVYFTGNTITNFEYGVQLAGNQQSWNPYPFIVKTINTTFFKNQIFGNTVNVSKDTGALAYNSDFRRNWWGSASGPNLGIISALGSYVPWCTNSACTTFGYPPVHNTTRDTYFFTIQAAINDSATQNGDVILVGAGTYDEDVIINKTLTLTGSGAGTTTIRGVLGGDNATVRIQANNVTVEGFTITRLGNNTTDWNNANLNTVGIGIITHAYTGAVIQNNIVTGNRTGIDINDTDGHIIRNNQVTNNRTGMIFRNQTDHLTVTGNEITNNWTAGIIFLDASNGTNIPVQTALYSTFSHNNISGNWYGQVVERQTGGSLPLPGTNLKNFSENWWGTTSPIVSTAESTEPGYAVQIPVVFGGTATAPGGQPDILGHASANIIVAPMCASSACTSFVYPPVHNTTRDTYFFTIQAAIDFPSTQDGDVITVAAGTYTEALVINKSVTLLGPNDAINPNTGARLAEAVIRGSTSSGLSNSANVNAVGVIIKGFTFDNMRIDNYNSSVADQIDGDVISNNIFTNVIGTPIYLRDGRNAPGLYSSGVEVSNNKINAIASAGAADFEAGSAMVVYGAEASIISGNVITSPSYNGIQLARCNGMTVSGNVVTGAPQPALQIAQWNDGTFQITGNTLSTTSTTRAAVRLYAFANEFYPLFNFTGNTIQDSRYAIQIGHGDAGKGYNDIRDADYSFSGNTFTNIGLYRLIVYLNTAASGAEITEMNTLFSQVYTAGSGASQINAVDPFTYIGMPVHVYVDDDYTPASSGGHIWGYDAFATITTGIAGVSTGGTVTVADGLYNEAVVVNKAGITLQSVNGRAATIIDVPDGSLTTGIRVLGENLGTVTIDGFTVRDFTENGIVQGMASRTGTTVHVLNNEIIPAATYLRNGIQVTGDGSTVIGNIVHSQYLTVDWSSTAIGVVNASNVIVQNNTITGIGNYGISVYNWGSATVQSNVQVLGNTIDGIDVPLAATAYYGGSVSGVDFHLNKLTHYVTAIEAEPYSDSSHTADGLLVEDIDAIHNWWGNRFGPQGPIYGTPAVIKWCATDACTTFLPNDLNVVEATSADSQTGAIKIYVPHITILLKNGTVIQNSSPCFEVYASYTTITTESIGGAQCVPTSDANGIEIADDLVNIVIQGIEFVGNNGTDGLHFAGTVTDMLLVDNWFHNFKGDGIEFAEPPAGVINIQGNLFQNNTGVGILNTNGTTAIDATYNSWGDVAGPTGPNGDGVSDFVTYAPFTHVDLYLLSSGSPVANQVLTGQSITYTVYAHVVNANAVDFRLAYPANLTRVGSPVNSGTFPQSATFDTSVANTIHFHGLAPLGTAVTGTVPVFSVTFTAGAPVASAAMNLDETTDAFGMIAYQSSANIYAAALNDGTVTILTSSAATGTLSMQGRTTRQGIPVTLTSTELFPWGPYLTTTLNAISNNLVFNNVAGGTYLFTTNQPRYLNVSADLAKTALITSAEVFTSLELKGGNANWTDNVISIQDATIIGTDYGSTNPASDGDVNFDGRVNIQDLAMVGGNYDLTSATAYATWEP